MSDKTPEQKKEEFIKKYGELVEEFQMDFANYPVYVPSPDGSFKTVIQSMVIEAKQPVKSNFMDNDKED